MTRTTTPSVLSLALFAAGSILTCGVLHAGPLDPPVGPITPTQKPLGEIEPRTVINATNTPGDNDSLFRITQPGSYYLTENISGVSGRSGIEISASGVTIDLNGFTLTGVAGSINGIESDPGFDRITVRNGILSGWGLSGIDLNQARGTLIESIISQNNAGIGIRSGFSSVVRFCTAVGNSNAGIIGFDTSLVESCHATSNGTFGIAVGPGSHVSRCNARQNGSHGISASNGLTTVSDCTAYFNTGSGINVGTGSTVIGCTASTNIVNGITAGGGAFVLNSNAHGNSETGIAVTTGASVINCRSGSNTLHGINAGSGCLILNNSCANNGSGTGDGAGVRVTGTDTRIEGNHCIGADRGIDVDATGNIIVRNTCAGNTTDWDIVANNIYGPIIDRRIPSPVTNTPAVTGTAATSTLNTTDPNANFTY